MRPLQWDSSLPKIMHHSVCSPHCCCIYSLVQTPQTTFAQSPLGICREFIVPFPSWAKYVQRINENRSARIAYTSLVLWT